MKKQQAYGNDSISAHSKGADRVGKHPAVIFSSSSSGRLRASYLKFSQTPMERGREKRNLIIMARAIWTTRSR